ncbi:Mevalonate kinase [Saxophila tyrrhenica]|uniref:Mevalonate kinase n=1 Tax=Saxophila tyrrhenica TaxID=1690608 RepID=A0AAV9NVW9_9PEZI|nr:Mevalonate kinase [Saxophila tyrrhenica]
MNGHKGAGEANGLSQHKMNGTNGKVNGLSDRSKSSDRRREASNGLSTSTSPSSRRESPASAHSRKESNPLAPPFIVSAPGKTIVYGEHAVVHGKAAIAAAISLRSYLLCTTLSKSKRIVTLKFSDIGLDHTWHIHDLPWSTFQRSGKKRKYYDRVDSLDEELRNAMKPHIATVSPDVEHQARKIHQAAASCFLYLFLSLGSESSPPCVYSMRSTIPIGQGLGSSASVSVCLAAALLLQCRALSGPHPDQESEEAAKQLQRINQWAFVGELVIHGNPSGVDNTVATNGHAVLFQRKDYTQPPSVNILHDFPELPLLLIDTRQPKATAAEVAKVGALKKKHPEVVERILDSIDAIVRSVYKTIENTDFDSSSAEADEAIAHLGEMMSVNHGLLTSLGVSHPRLERLRYLVDQAGVGWTKLTGAGGGGCAITLLKPQPRATHGVDGDLNGEAATASPPTTPSHEHGDRSLSSALQDLEQQLEDEGFDKYATTLGGDGVGVLYPAIINDEEIDQEMFLTAEGREGVHELVGGGQSGAWKYWRP